MSKAKYLDLSFSLAGRAVAVVTLKRPPVNALNNPMQRELAETIHSLNTNSDITMAVLRADKCAGVDLQEMTQRPLLPYITRDFAQMFDTISTFRKPLIGVMNGPLIGAGTTLAILCHYTIASDNSRFGYPEKLFGLRPSISAPYAISQMGRVNALHYFSEGSIFTADKAARMNIINEICPLGELQKTMQRRVNLFLEKPELLIPRPQATQKGFEGGTTQTPEMTRMVDNAIALYKDRSETGRAKLVEHTSRELSTDAAQAQVQVLIGRYLANKETRRSI